MQLYKIETIETNKGKFEVTSSLDFNPMVLKLKTIQKTIVFENKEYDFDNSVLKTERLKGFIKPFEGIGYLEMQNYKVTRCSKIQLCHNVMFSVYIEKGFKLKSVYEHALNNTILQINKMQQPKIMEV